MVIQSKTVATAAAADRASEELNVSDGSVN